MSRGAWTEPAATPSSPPRPASAIASSSRIVDLEATALGDLDGDLRQPDGRQGTGRLVGKVAGEPGRVGDHAAPLETAFGGGDLLGADDDRERLEWVGVTGVVRV